MRKMAVAITRAEKAVDDKTRCCIKELCLTLNGSVHHITVKKFLFYYLITQKAPKGKDTAMCCNCSLLPGEGTVGFPNRLSILTA